MSFAEEIRTLLEKSREDSMWDPHHLWCILTALRGPDSDNEELKDLTTRRLRHIVFPGGLITLSRVTPLSTKEVSLRNKLLITDSDHFYCHFKDALRTAETLGYNVPEDELNFEIGV